MKENNFNNEKKNILENDLDVIKKKYLSYSSDKRKINNRQLNIKDFNNENNRILKVFPKSNESIYLNYIEIEYNKLYENFINLENDCINLKREISFVESNNIKLEKEILYKDKIIEDLISNEIKRTNYPTKNKNIESDSINNYYEDFKEEISDNTAIFIHLKNKYEKLKVNLAEKNNEINFLKKENIIYYKLKLENEKYKEILENEREYMRERELIFKTELNYLKREKINKFIIENIEGFTIFNNKKISNVLIFIKEIIKLNKISFKELSTYLFSNYSSKSLSSLYELDEFNIIIVERLMKILKIPKEYNNLIKIFFEITINKKYHDYNSFLERFKQMINLEDENETEKFTYDNYLFII